MISPPLIYSVHRVGRGWHCTCSWCQKRRWHGAEPDRHPFLREPVAHDPVVPKPGGRIVPLPRREVRS